MKKQDYRLIEFKGTNEKRKGLFHRWRKIVSDDKTEFYVAVIEDLSNGKMIENEQQEIRFLTQKESEDFWAEEENRSIW